MNSFASNDVTYIVSLTKTPDKSYVEDVPNRHRMPQKQITAVISMADGVQIPGVDLSEILLYEVYDSEGILIATFSSEDGFIDFIFSNPNSFQIRLITNSWIYTGYMNL